MGHYLRALDSSPEEHLHHGAQYQRQVQPLPELATYSHCSKTVIRKDVPWWHTVQPAFYLIKCSTVVLLWLELCYSKPLHYLSTVLSMIWLRQWWLFMYTVQNNTETSLKLAANEGWVILMEDSTAFCSITAQSVIVFNIRVYAGPEWTKCTTHVRGHNLRHSQSSLPMTKEAQSLFLPPLTQ